MQYYTNHQMHERKLGSLDLDGHWGPDAQDSGIRQREDMGLAVAQLILPFFLNHILKT